MHANIFVTKTVNKDPLEKVMKTKSGEGRSYPTFRFHVRVIMAVSPSPSKGTTRIRPLLNNIGAKGIMPRRIGQC